MMFPLLLVVPFFRAIYSSVSFLRFSSYLVFAFATNVKICNTVSARLDLSFAFVPKVSPGCTARSALLSILHASKSNPPNKDNFQNNEITGVSSNSGFGKPPKPTKQKQLEKLAKTRSIFPELEPYVRQTLVASFMNGTNEDLGNVLPEDIYDRLEEIYGLGKFNFGGQGSIYASIGVCKDSALNGNETSKLDSLSFQSIKDASRNSFDELDGLFTQPSPQESPNYDLNLLSPFTKFRVLHTDPMVLAIDDFFTSLECDRYIQISLESEKMQILPERSGEAHRLQPMLVRQSQTVGKDSRSKAQRTSTTWFHYYEGAAELMAKASRLLGLEGLNKWEEPQTVRYRCNEKFTWHLDALSPDEASNPLGAGQREATLLVYLTDMLVEEGGATMFRDLGGGDGSSPLKIRPKKGTALLFFPSAGGIPNAPFDIRTLHCGEAVSDDSMHEKWIAQLWLRQRTYSPTAPPGNSHKSAFEAIGLYCNSMKM